jgi:hypothetical protein
VYFGGRVYTFGAHDTIAEMFVLENEEWLGIRDVPEVMDRCTGAVH